MPDDDIPKFETAEHDTHDDFRESTGASGDSDAAAQGKGSFATSDGQTGPGGTAVADAAQGAGASSADGTADTGDAGAPAHEPQPPHTGSGPFPDPPQP
jgi:hypothetical protein